MQENAQFAPQYFVSSTRISPIESVSFLVPIVYNPFLIFIITFICHPEPVEGPTHTIESWIRQAHHDNVFVISGNFLSNLYIV